MVPAPAASVGSSSNGVAAATPITLQPSDGISSFPDVPADTPVLVEDAIGNGATGILDKSSTLRLSDPVPVLIPPLRVLFNLLRVTRGKTVANEVLGAQTIEEGM